VSISSHIAAAATAILFAWTAAAQSMSGAIAGRVTSKSKALDHVKVTVDSDAMQSTRTVSTSARGTYWAGVLPPGVYRITFAHAGTQTVTRKAELHAGETVHVDADLQPSEEGETVTMTTIARAVLEQPRIVTTVEPEVIEPLPIGRELSARIALVPGIDGVAVRGSSDNLWIVDGVEQRRRGADVEVEDAIEDVSVLTTPTSAEYGRFTGGVILGVSHSGSNELTGSLRASGGKDGRSRLEAAAGGRIIRDALWLFLAGETREDSLFGKVTSTLTRHTLIASALRAVETDESRAAAEYVGALTSRLVVTARSDTSRVGDLRERNSAIAIHDVVPTRIADQVMTAGGESHALFFDDELRAARWLFHAGLRRDDDAGTSPRLGIAYDLHGTGSMRIALTHGRYATTFDGVRETALTYAQRILTNGYVRVALVRRQFDRGNDYRGVEADARAQYLFFNLGAMATVAHRVREGALWISGAPPALEQHITVSILEQYRDARATTNIAALYRFTRWPWEPFAKLEALDIFSHRRGLRASLGLAF
jgi:hypothetical protein